MKKITIYTNEACPYCKQIKEKLEEKNIKFKNKLTNEHKDEWQQIINLTGIPTIPTVEYMNEYFIPSRDFQNPQQLINILETFNESKHNDSKRTLERIKTLNFHINTAFGRLDQLLKRIENKLNIDEQKK